MTEHRHNGETARPHLVPKSSQDEIYILAKAGEAKSHISNIVALLIDVNGPDVANAPELAPAVA